MRVARNTMLAKKNKLPIGLFKNQKSRTFRNSFFTLKVFNGEVARLGIIVSAKVAKKATDRNKLKRLIFSFFRKVMPNLPRKDYLLIAQPGASGLKPEALQKELKQIFTNLN
jgi:ribonuclease P protein component